MNKYLKPWGDFKKEFFEKIIDSREATQFLFLLLDALSELGIKMFLRPLLSQASKSIWACSSKEFSPCGIYLYCDDMTTAGYLKIKIIFRGGDPNSKTIQDLRKIGRQDFIDRGGAKYLEGENDLRKFGAENIKTYAEKIAKLLWETIEHYDCIITTKTEEIKKIDKQIEDATNGFISY